MHSLFYVATLKNSWKYFSQKSAKYLHEFLRPVLSIVLICSIGKLFFSISGSVFIYLKPGIIIAKVAIWNIFVLFCFPLVSFCFALFCCCFVVCCAVCVGLSSRTRTRKLGILGNYANVSISIKWFWWGTKVDFMLGWLWLGLCGDRRVRSALLPRPTGQWSSPERR